jgi:hypothetical protein
MSRRVFNRVFKNGEELRVKHRSDAVATKARLEAREWNLGYGLDDMRKEFAPKDDSCGYLRTARKA